MRSWLPDPLPDRLRLLPLLLLVAGVAVLASCSRSSFPGPDDAVDLRRGSILEVEVAPGEGTRVPFLVDGGEYLEVSVHQQGVDVVVLLRSPDGETVYEVDSPTGSQGVEEVVWVAEEPGLHTFELKPYDPEATGQVRLEVTDRHPASESEKRQAAARTALAAADRRRDEGREEAAVAAWDEVLRWLATDSPLRPTALWKQGETLYEVGELRRAASVLEEALQAFRSRDDRLGQARAWTDLGVVREALGELEGAAEAHRQALALYRDLGVPQGVATALHNLAGAAAARGDVAAAVRGYSQALEDWRQLDRPRAEAMTLQALGNLYARLGRDREARDYLERALARLPGTAEEERRALWVDLAWLRFLEGRADAALEQLDRVVDEAGSGADPMELAALLGRRATVLRSLGRLDEAREGYRTALRLAEESGARLGASHTRANLGWLELEAGSPAVARRWLRSAVSSFEQQGDLNGQVYARVGLGRLHRVQGRMDAARRELERAVAQVEELRAGVPGVLSRSHFLATRFDAFQELALLELELARQEPGAGHEARALEVVERSRARSLLDQLRGTGDRQRAEERRRVLAEANALEARRLELYRSDPGDPRLATLESSIRLRLLEAEQLEGPAPGAGHEEARPPALDVPGLQALLDDETLLVTYLLAEPHSWAWTLSRDDLQTHRLPGQAEIEGRARQLLERIAVPATAVEKVRLEMAFQRLGEAVVAPLAGRLAGYPRLAVVADGALLAVPFGALPDPSSPARPLLAGHEVVGLPSGTVLAWQRRTLAGRPAAEGVVAVVADPVFGPEEGTDAGAVLPADLSRSMADLDLMHLPRLGATAREAAAIAALAPPGKRWERTRYGATRQAVTSGDLRGYRILHFATHGLLHPQQPELSGLVLSLVDPEGRPRDGFLRAHEVASLELPAELAVLSACRTGLGRELRGEGLVGLTQAFFQAGVRRVVVTRWNVNDPSTAVLMERFYVNLWQQGMAPAAALRAAQLSLSREEAWSAPYYWASFQLLGDWR